MAHVVSAVSTLEVQRRKADLALLAREAFDYEENGHGGWSVYAYEPDGKCIWLSEHTSDTDARNEVETLVRVTSLWMEV